MLIQLLFFVIILGLIWWLITLLPLPEPFGRIAQVILVIIAIVGLFGLIGYGPGLVR